MLYYVPIPCPSGAHDKSILVYRDFTNAVLSCLPCEATWSVPASTQEIRDVPGGRVGYGPVDSTTGRNRH